MYLNPHPCWANLDLPYTLYRMIALLSLLGKRNQNPFFPIPVIPCLTAVLDR
jgi:hypothetical protein